VPESFRGGCSFGAGATLTLVKPISPADATLFMFAPLVKMRPLRIAFGVHTNLQFFRLMQQVHTYDDFIRQGLRSHRNGAPRWSSSPPDSTPIAPDSRSRAPWMLRWHTPLGQSCSTASPGIEISSSCLQPSTNANSDLPRMILNRKT